MDVTTYMVNKSRKYLESLILNAETILNIIEDHNCKNNIDYIPLQGIRQIICDMNDIVMKWSKETCDCPMNINLPNSFLGKIYLKQNNFYLKLPFFDVNIYYYSLDSCSKKKLKSKTAFRLSHIISSETIDYNFANMKLGIVQSINVLKKYLNGLKYLNNYFDTIIKSTKFDKNQYIISKNMYKFNNYYSEFIKK